MYRPAVGRDSSLVGASPERVVRFSARTVLRVIGLVIAAWACSTILSIARHVLTWILVALFLALALNPAVDWFDAPRLKRAVLAAGSSYFLAPSASIVGIGFLFIPTLVNQVNDFVQAVPGYVDDLTKGRGRLGFLETKYHIVEKIRKALNERRRVEGPRPHRHGDLDHEERDHRSSLATITIAFLTFFMLLEGPAWMERFYGLLPERSQPRWRASATTSTARSAAT